MDTRRVRRPVSVPIPLDSSENQPMLPLPRATLPAISPEDHQKMASLGEKGLKSKDIQRHLNPYRTLASVIFACHEHPLSPSRSVRFMERTPFNCSIMGDWRDGQDSGSP